MIRRSDHTQLRFLAWSRPTNACLDDAEAFALYESNWRFIEPASLTAGEAALIQRLTREQGKGLLLA